MTEIPALFIRDLVVFPGMVLPVALLRSKSIAAVDRAAQTSGKIFVVTQRDPTCNEPSSIDDLYPVGVIAQLLHSVKMPDGTAKVAVEAEQRAGLQSLVDTGTYWTATVLPLLATIGSKPELDRVCIGLRELVTERAMLASRTGREIGGPFKLDGNCSELVDSILAALVMPREKKQELLELLDIVARAETALIAIKNQVDEMMIEISEQP